MVTKAENKRLTSVESDAPMARLMRETYWLPFSRMQALQANAPPTRVRLLGEDYVAFRAEDGRIGFLQEACPHRGASLALGRVEGCHLQCIFHGWKIDVSGKVAEIPTEGARSASVAAHVPVEHYPTQEQGGLIWVFLGSAAPPAMPDLPFFNLPEDNIWLSRSVVPVNWLQGLEAALDSAHVGVLHAGWPRAASELDNQSRLLAIVPKYSVEETVYGMRGVAIRDGDDGTTLLRVSEYLLPFIAMAPGSLNAAPGEAAVFIAVPIDDENHLLFWGLFNQNYPLGPFFMRDQCTDQDNYAQLRGSKADNWGQDREAMARGHFSGFTEQLFMEDVVVQVSMGRIANRSRDFLTHTDIAVARCRQLLLRLLDRFEQGEKLDGAIPGLTRSAVPIGKLIPADVDWHEVA